MQNQNRPSRNVTSNNLEQNLSRIDQSLEVMESHAGECQDVEFEVQDAMRKRDREYKDEHLHSVPRARKHSR